MTKARDLANIISTGVPNSLITLDANEIPNIPASKITSGTFADARLSQSSVQQYASTFDDNKIVNDISTLAIRQASNENKSAYNTNSMYVDVFQDSTGITNLTNALRNSAEYMSTISSSEAYETGDRTSSYTVTANNITISSGNVTNLVDGDFNANATGGFWWSASTVASGDTIVFDLGSGNSKIYIGAKWYQENASGHGNWVWQGSNNNSSWTDLNSGFQLGGATSSEQTWSNDTAHRYIRLRGVSGSRSNNPWNTEVEFKVKTLNVNATGSFESNAITASSSTNKMGAIITYQDNAGTNALNTDIVLKLSADGGSNYTTATMTAMPDFASGIKMAKVNDLSVTAGTSLKYKLEFANQASGSKEARIRGVSLQY